MAKQDSKRVHLLIDPERHPQLFAWVEGNPYHWADFVRGAAEASLARGDVPEVKAESPLASVPPMPSKARRGSRAARRNVSVRPPATPAAPGKMPAAEAAAPARSAPAIAETRETPAQEAQAPVVEQAPVIKPARDVVPHAPIADAAEQPPQNQNKNTVHPEPAQDTQADQGEVQDEKARLRELAKRALLGNDAI